MTNIFRVTMVRVYSNHEYVIGFYSTWDNAKEAAEVETTWRGGKYNYRIEQVELDPPIDEQEYDYHLICTAPGTYVERNFNLTENFRADSPANQ